MFWNRCKCKTVEVLPKVVTKRVKKELKYTTKSFEVGKALLEYTLRDGTVFQSCRYGTIWQSNNERTCEAGKVIVSKSSEPYNATTEIYVGCEQTLVNDPMNPTKYVTGIIASLEVLGHESHSTEFYVASVIETECEC